MNKFVIVDLETTGQTPAKGERIIEIGIVVLQDNKIVREYSKLINPKIPIPPFVSSLTGITDNDVIGAPMFEEVAAEIASLFDDSYIVAHNVPFDLGFLNFELNRAGLASLHQPVIDTVELSRILLPSANGFKLSQLSEYLSLEHGDPHRALSDAYVTAELLSFLLEKLQTLPYETIAQLQQLEPRLKSDLFQILEERLQQLAFSTQPREDLEVYRGLAIKQELTEDDFEINPLPSFGDLLDQLFNHDGSFANTMEEYEERPGQRQMSEQIFDAFQANQHALIEAETGTGKSLAYLIPVLYDAVKNKQRVIISTHLIQLQTQLLEKEAPVLKELLPFPFKTALMKGKQHYLSLQKFEQELMDLGQDNYDITLTKAIILVWLTETITGDIDEIQLPSSGMRYFRRISTDSEGVMDPHSPWFSRSFYQRARVKAHKADVVITNHALICSDMTSESNLLPSYKRLIVDEAHHLESTASKHFGLKLDYVSIHNLLNSISLSKQSNLLTTLTNQYKPIKRVVDDFKWEKLWEQTKEESDELFRMIFRFVSGHSGKDITENDTGRLQCRIDDSVVNTKQWNVIKEMVDRLSFNVRDLIHILSNVLLEVKQLDQLKDQTECESELRNIIELLQRVIDDCEELFIKQVENQVSWIEIEANGAKNAVYIYAEPVNVSTLLQENLFATKQSVVLTSATLTMKQSFAFIKERLGLGGYEVLESKIESPYAYESQVQLMVPDDFPNIKHGKTEDFIVATCEAIYSLAEVTNGRMLVLFTSYDMLKKTYSMLKEIITTDQYMLIAQGISSGSRARLKKNFQAFEKAILLGTSSFWEGVDIPGSDLSCIVIVRLPFQPPNHPIYEAKSQQLKQVGRNPFMELALPNAVIRFKQGFGRLIRSSSDRGIVFVCDDRLINARYGKYFVESIPKVPLSYQSTQKLIQKAQDWL
ncbi:ATP-dependent DNA helicase DinG [Aquibacillus sediminis]|uniref:ATP-dependent DNA helicase DinG n=1 Tax=Aquibacillus sediminis TaxID=2574734 RepID=UPI00110A00C8|nr:ATP-dependent DNA helicase DinG [Aquibacillus sediminis]